MRRLYRKGNTAARLGHIGQGHGGRCRVAQVRRCARTKGRRGKTGQKRGFQDEKCPGNSRFAQKKNSKKKRRGWPERYFGSLPDQTPDPGQGYRNTGHPVLSRPPIGLGTIIFLKDFIRLAHYLIGSESLRRHRRASAGMWQQCH